MYIDKQNLFSEDQAITADAASTNVIDLGADAAAIASVVEKGDTKILCQVTEVFNNLTSLTVKVETDDNASFSSATELLQATVALADLAVGKIVPLGVLPVGCERYVRLNFDVTGTAPTTGKVLAGLILDQQTN